MCFTKLFLGLVCTNEGSRSRDICQKQVMKFPRRLSTTFLSLPHPNQTRRERHFRVWLDPKKKKTVPSCQRLEYPTICTCPGYKFLCLEVQEGTRRRKKENDNISCSVPQSRRVPRILFIRISTLHFPVGQVYFAEVSARAKDFEAKSRSVALGRNCKWQSCSCESALPSPSQLASSFF